MSKISLREYFEARLTAIEKATELKTESLNERFQSVNEFRATLSDQAAHFVTRIEMKLLEDKIQSTISPLQEFKAEMKGKASQSAFILTGILGVISTILSVISLLWNILK